MNNLKRFFSTQLKYSNVSITINQNQSTLRNEKFLRLQKNPEFGTIFSDHMFEAKWNNHIGWHDSKIEPFHNLSLHPASGVLHYAFQAFDGLKAFRNIDNDRIFFLHISKYVRRFLYSIERLCLPTFDEKEFIKILKKLVDIDSYFVPDGRLHQSLYIRPFLFADNASLKLIKPNSAQLNVIMSCCGNYLTDGCESIKIYCETNYFRTSPGGLGNCKAACNYAPTIHSSSRAMKLGYSQTLWLYPTDNDYIITECDTSNIFFLILNENGEKELITPSLCDNLTLPGITRNSIIQLSKSYNKFLVSEKVIYLVKDIIKLLNENRVIEVFCSGTAVTMLKVTSINFNNIDYPIMDQMDDKKEGFSLFNTLRNDLVKIQQGTREFFDIDENSNWATYI